MKISLFTAKPGLIKWQPGMSLSPGMVVRCFGNELFEVIKAATACGCEVLTLNNKGRNSEWHATISAKSPDKNG